MILEVQKQINIDLKSLIGVSEASALQRPAAHHVRIPAVTLVLKSKKL